jgi:hypothetical protein
MLSVPQLALQKMQHRCARCLVSRRARNFYSHSTFPSSDKKQESTMFNRPYAPAEFNARMDEAKIRAAQLRREAANAWGAKLWRLLCQMRSKATEGQEMARTSSANRNSTCPT